MGRKQYVYAKRELFADEKTFEYIDRNYLYMFLLIQKREKDSHIVSGQNDRVFYNGTSNIANDFKSETEQCLFCGKKPPEISFSVTEHMFSEMLGNKTFISKNRECDACNGLFAKYENDLSIFLKPLLVLDGINTKDGKQKYKSFDYKTRISHIMNELSIVTAKDNGQINDDQGELVVNFDIPSYSPLKCYKALCKMALSILKSEELKEYSETLNYLQDENRVFGYEYFIYSFFPGFNRFDFTVLGIKKKSNAKDKYAPSYQFLIMNNNFSLQVSLYKDNELAIADFSKIKPVSLPTPFDLSVFGNKTPHIFKIDGDKKIEKHAISVTLKYDTREEITTIENEEEVYKTIEKIENDLSKAEQKRNAKK